MKVEKKRSLSTQLVWIVGVCSLPFVLGLLALVVLGWAGSAAPTTCELDPGLREIGLLCAVGRADDDACLFYESTLHLARADRDRSRDVLLQGLGVPEETADRLVPGIQALSLGMLQVDTQTACGRAQVLQLLGFMAGGFWERWDSPAAGLFFGPLLYSLPPEAVAMLEQKTPEDLAPRIVALRTSFEDTLARTHYGAMIVEGAPLAVARALVQSSPASESVESQETVAAALALARDGEVAEARRQVVAAAEGLPPDEAGLLFFRYGMGLQNVGASEDAVLMIRRAEEVLATSRTPRSDLLRQLAPAMEHLIWSDLGVEPPRRSEGGLRDHALAQMLSAAVAGSETGESGGIPAAARVVLGLAGTLSWDDDEVEALVEVLWSLPGLEDLTDLEERPDVWARGEAYWQDFFSLQHQIRRSEPDPTEAARALERFGAHLPAAEASRLNMAATTLRWLSGRITEEDADRQIRQALDAFENQVKEAYRLDRSMVAYVEQAGPEIYSWAIDFSVETGRVEQAFAYAERGRSWTFRRRLGGRAFASDPDYEQTLRDAAEKLAETERLAALGATSSTDVDEARRHLESLPLLQRLRQPEHFALGVVQPAEAASVRENLGPGQTLVSYYFLDDETLLVWVIDGAGSVLRRLALPEDFPQLLACHVDAIEMVTTRGGGPVGRLPCREPRARRSELYEMLIEPIRSAIHGEEVILVPHGPLHHVPFAALQDAEGRYLGESYRIALLPSASVLQILREAAAQEPGGGSKSVLVLGAPELDAEWSVLGGARRESQTVAALLGTKARVGRNATESALRRHAPEAGLIHVAAHAVYDRQTPRQSRLLLAGDEKEDGSLTLLEVEEVLDLRGTRLVALSACETGLGELSPGDEIVGLSRGFLVAGAQAVVSTLWRVEDEASAGLMVAFYSHFMQGMPAAESMQQAQELLRNDPATEAPYYWAGYTLTGLPQTSW